MEKLYAARAARAEFESSRFPLLSFSAVVLPEDMEAMQALWSSADFGRCEVGQLRVEAAAAPPVMSEALEKTILENEEPAPLVEGPEWMGSVAQRRISFEGAAFSSCLDGREHVSMFMLAVQQPKSLCF